jgi:hypothetical protein
MKKLILILALTSLSAIADDEVYAGTMTQDAIQQNTASNAPTSVMSNTQLNGGTTFDSYGGGVTCSRATFQGGMIGNVKGQYRQGAQLYMGISVPIFSGDDCKQAARTQTTLNEWRVTDLKEAIKQGKESHAEEIKRSKLMYADLLAKVCQNHHQKMSASVGSLMDLECDKFLSLTHNKQKHNDHGVKYEGYERISSHH